MDNQRIIQLAQKFVDGSITAHEIEEFNDWYYSDEGEHYKVNAFNSKEDLALDMFRNVIERAGLGIEKPRTIKLWVGIAAAVGAVAVIVFGIWFFNAERIASVPRNDMAFNDIAPGKSGATLTLANGQKIFINDVLVGNIASQSGVKISKTKNGQIIYEVTDQGAGKIEYNTLTTTRGEQTQVRLPDSSLVFLNAASSLRYPTSFAKAAKRSVGLTGEGYFEIAKDKAHPFVVIAANQEVEVLGTHFNVNAYPEEASVKTTLLEGAVAINGKIFLKPGQQSIFNAGNVRIVNADVEMETAWKNGRFIFDGQDFKTITSNIARWYNVDISYDATLAYLHFGGQISRSRSLSGVLKMLEGTGDVKFKVEGRRISVTK